MFNACSIRFGGPPVLSQHRPGLFDQRVQQGRPNDRVPTIERRCFAQRFETLSELPVEA
jgi:hypothetical protein